MTLPAARSGDRALRGAVSGKAREGQALPYKRRRGRKKAARFFRLPRHWRADSEAGPGMAWRQGGIRPTRWESVSPFVKLTGNRTSTAGRGPFSAWPDGNVLRRKEYTIRVN